MDLVAAGLPDLTDIWTVGAIRKQAIGQRKTQLLWSDGQAGDLADRSQGRQPRV